MAKNGRALSVGERSLGYLDAARNRRELTKRASYRSRGRRIEARQRRNSESAALRRQAGLRMIQEHCKKGQSAVVDERMIADEHFDLSSAGDLPLAREQTRMLQHHRQVRAKRETAAGRNDLETSARLCPVEHEL